MDDKYLTHMEIQTAQRAAIMPQRRHATVTTLGLLLALAPFAGLAAQAADIEIRVDGSVAGATLHAALQSADAAHWEPLLRQAQASDGTLRFAAVPPGRYAVQLFVDRNGNGRPDFSPRGLPLEPVGFSGNPPLLRGKPAPPHCAFAHGETLTRLHIPLRPPRGAGGTR